MWLNTPTTRLLYRWMWCSQGVWLLSFRGGKLSKAICSVILWGYVSKLQQRRGRLVAFLIIGSSFEKTLCPESYSPEEERLDSLLYIIGGKTTVYIDWLFSRYRKGEKEFFGSQWWEMHAELMIIASEIVLPMSITAIVATSGSHDSYHAKWVDTLFVGSFGNIWYKVDEGRNWGAASGRLNHIVVPFCLLYVSWKIEPIHAH